MAHLISAWRRCSFSVARWTARVYSVCSCAAAREGVKKKLIGRAGGAYGGDGVVAVAEGLESVLAR